MRIIPTINIPFRPLGIQPHHSGYINTLNCDKFEYSTPPISNISFQSNVSNGQFLRKLSGVHDPYSGVIIINNKEMNQAFQDLSKLRSGQERVKYLKQYKASMLPIEKSVFELCEAEIKHDRYLSLQKIIEKKQPKAMKGLIKEQLTVFKEINEQLPYISDENKAKLSNILTKSEAEIRLPYGDKNYFKKNRFIDNLVYLSQDKTLRTIEENISEMPEEERLEALGRLYDVERILMNNPHNVNVQGKTPLEHIRDLQVEFAPETLDEPSELEPIIEIAQKLPTNKDSVNAYIVEMAGKDDETIAKRFISESLGTIEHIVPESKGGVNEAYNFLFVTKSRNNERSNMDIKKFMKKYPNIPQYCQEYINDILKAGQTSKIKGHEWYPYVIKETIKEEMNTNVNISNYRMSPQKAFKAFPQRLQERYPKFEKYFTNTQ